MREYLAVLFSEFESEKSTLLSLHRNGLSHLLLDALNASFSGNLAHPDVTRKLALYYHAGGIFNSFMLWFDTGMVMDAAEFAAVCASVLKDDARPMLPALLARSQTTPRPFASEPRT